MWGFLKSMLGLAASNAYLNHQIKKEEEEYNQMINGLDGIQDAFDDLSDTVDEVMTERINGLLSEVDDLLSYSSYDDKENYYMPVLLVMFYEIILYQGQIQESQLKFLNLLVSRHPFSYATDMSNIDYVYSYSDAFNYDGSINGNLRKVGEVGTNSYAWFQIHKDRCILFGFDNIKIDLKFIANHFYSMPFLLKSNEEYPMFSNFSERLDVCEPIFKLLYEKQIT